MFHFFSHREDKVHVRGVINCNYAGKSSEKCCYRMTKSLVGALHCNLTALFPNPEASVMMKGAKSETICKHLKRGKEQKQDKSVENPQGHLSASSAVFSLQELADLWSPSNILCSRGCQWERGQVQGNCLRLTDRAQILAETRSQACNLLSTIPCGSS